jgi:hypothetical protein
MCGKNISTSAVVGGVNEVHTYVHMFAHIKSGEKLMIMILNHFLPLNF